MKRLFIAYAVLALTACSPQQTAKETRQLKHRRQTFQRAPYVRKVAREPELSREPSPASPTTPRQFKSIDAQFAIRSGQSRGIDRDGYGRSRSLILPTAAGLYG